MRTVLVLLGLAAMSGLGGVTAGAAGGARDVLPEKEGKVAKVETVRGTLQSVDNSEIKVRTEAKESVALKLDSQTKIRIDGKDGALTGLKSGQLVTCTMARREGQNICLSVEATSPKK
jgi:hypothetical protein